MTKAIDVWRANAQFFTPGQQATVRRWLEEYHQELVHIFFEVEVHDPSSGETGSGDFFLTDALVTFAREDRETTFHIAVSGLVYGTREWSYDEED